MATERSPGERGELIRLGFQTLFNMIGTHVPSRSLRRWWLARLGASIARDAVVYRGTTVLGAGRLVIGRRSQVGWRCVLDARGGLTLGDDVMVASDSRLISADHDVRSPDFAVRYGSVRLEQRAWLGTGAMVLQGVTIGRGAVVAAGAVATRDVEPLTIVGGIPARPFATRPDGLTYEIGPSPRFY
jgi:acetyltransferase-like isoleucine patch superfamily enzyme